MAKLARFFPVIFGIGFLALFAIGLTLPPPQEIESAYKNKPLPVFSLPPLFEQGDALTAQSLRNDAPVLLNVFCQLVCAVPRRARRIDGVKIARCADLCD